MHAQLLTGTAVQVHHTRARARTHTHTHSLTHTHTRTRTHKHKHTHTHTHTYARAHTHIHLHLLRSCSPVQVHPALGTRHDFKRNGPTDAWDTAKLTQINLTRTRLTQIKY
jgi:3'-phosphoadenosine 5'-phosphosulfate (PAPS) 3'-phosphatase